MALRDYTFLGTTRSLCPTCRRLVDAKIIVRGQRGRRNAAGSNRTSRLSLVRKAGGKALGLLPFLQMAAR